MGREIVYCWKCAKRLDGDDFEQLKAYRYGDKVSCDECVYDLVGDLPADEQEAILNGTYTEKKTPAKMRPPSDTARRPARTGATTRTTATTRTGQTGKTPITRSTGKVPLADGGSAPRRGTRSIPKVEPPPEEEAVEGADAAAKKKKLILIGVGGGGLLLVVVVVLMLLLMGGKKAKPPAVAADPETRTTEKKPDPPKPSREAEAKKAYDAAMAVFKDKAGDLGAQMKALRDAELVSAGTSLEESVKTQLEVLGLEVDKQLKAIDGEIAPFLPDSKFKDALAVLAVALAKHDFPEWTKGVEKKIAQTKAILEDRFLNEKKRALEAKDSGETARVNEIVAKVTAWEVPELVERLKKELGAVEAPPPDAPATPDATAKTPAVKKPKRAAKALSKEMQSYQSSWERAAGLAFTRDFDGAMTELRRAVKEIDSDEVRKESGVDLELLEQLKAWVEEAVKLQSKTKPHESVSLEIHDRPGEFKVVAGRVTKIFDQRFELRATVDKDGKKVSSAVFVEYADLTGRSLAEQVKKLREPAKNDGRMAGLLCLLEGNEESAQALGGKEAESLPDRYWVHAADAKEKAPKSNSKEFEARNLFHKAEVEYKEMQTRGTSLDKYKTLLNEYSTTRIVQRNQASIVKRGEVGKEFTFNARGFKTEGAFKPTKKPDLVLQGTKDVDVQEMKENYVEAEFYALPGVTYRSWAYVGGCCKETLSFYLQTSERTTTHQGKQLAIDPGANMAEQVKHQISGLKNDHAAHAPKDKKAPHPKDATRWEWVPIPLAKTYSAAGPKSIRLMTDQAGFAVKFIVVSSLRTKTPDEKDMAEFVRQLNEEPAAAEDGVKGTPEPKEWLIAGPFNEPLNARAAPENDIDLAKEMTGKGNKKFKWKVTPATIQSGYAVFNWEDGKVINPKDAVSAYVLIHVRAPSPMTVQLSLGHDDGGRAWVNGEMVHSNDRGGGVKNDEFKAKATLEEGWNRVLVKVRTTNGGFGLSFRILDEAGAPAQGLSYSPYGDQLVPP
ncbi:MAG TPA: hypothetical protein VF950_08615 [Planctomycetota bacterium]